MSSDTGTYMPPSARGAPPLEARGADGRLRAALWGDGCLFGAFGGVCGFAVVVMWSQRVANGDWVRLLGAVALALIAQHWIIQPLHHRLDTGSNPPARENLFKAARSSLAMLAVFEVFVIAFEGLADFQSEHLRLFGQVILGPALIEFIHPRWLLVGTFVGLWIVVGTVVAGSASAAIAAVRRAPRRSPWMTTALCLAWAWESVLVGTLAAVLALRGVAGYAVMGRRYAAWSAQVHVNLHALGGGPAGTMGSALAGWAVWPVDKFAGFLDAHGITGAWLPAATIAGLLLIGALLGPRGLLWAVIGVMVPPVLPALLAENSGPLLHFLFAACVTWSIPATVLGASLPWLESQAARPRHWVLLAGAAGTGLALLAIVRTAYWPLLLGGTVVLGLFAVAIGVGEQRRPPWPAIALTLTALVLGGILVQDRVLGDLSFSALGDRYLETFVSGEAGAPVVAGEPPDARIGGRRRAAVAPPTEDEVAWEGRFIACQHDAATELANADTTGKNAATDRLWALGERIEGLVRDGEKALPAGGAIAPQSDLEELRRLYHEAVTLADQVDPIGRRERALRFEMASVTVFGFWATLAILSGWTRMAPRESGRGDAGRQARPAG